ncbi:MAG: protein kinase, partial [Candidatus Aminicenantes bacterium]|nr:protein kinase [Candidatus Aminicenantes bacterium]
ASVNTEDLSGTAVSHYRILERLGEGGMGVVYRAEDTRLKRMVALKFVRPERSRGHRENARFQREAEAAASLNHPHIATIHEIGEADGRLFISMEFVDGPNLRDLLRSGPLDPAQGLTLAVQLAGALQAAHDRGIIHRDIKTDNVMLTREGSAKVMDFGLARPEDGQSGTLTEGIVGTVPYMSPEQACGEPVDHRTDIWSLGVVLYEIFTGRHPFRAAGDRAMLTAIVTGMFEPLTAARPGLPLELERIVGRCLEKQPEKRYRKAADLRADLERLHKAAGGRTLTAAGAILPGPGFAFYLKKYRRRILAFVGAAAFLSAILVRPVRETVGGWLGIRSKPAVTSLAVLPFVVNGGDEKDRAFAAGLVEMLTSKLTRVERSQESFRIVPAAVAREFGPAGVEKARKALKIDQVITGGIQFDENRIYLTLHLNDARNVRILKSVDIDAPRNGLGALPESVAGAAAGLLELVVSADIRRAWEERSVCHPDATPLVIQARGYLQRYENPDSVDIAVGLLTKVVEMLDGRCAAAFAALGEAYWYKYFQTQEKPYIDQAQSAAEKALSLDGTMAEVHVTMGIIHRQKGKLEDSLAELEKARDLDPRSEAAVRELGGTLEMLGRAEEAERAYRKAIELRPEAWSGYHYLGAFYYQRGNYAGAEANWKRITELTPDNLLGYTLLGALYLQRGRNGEAVQMFQRSLEIKPTADAYSNLGTAFFFDRKYEGAAEMYEKAITLEAGRPVLWGNLGDAYRYVLGGEDKARRAYETAVRLTRDALSLNPVSGNSHKSLARYLVFLGGTDEALVEIARARELLPENPDVLETAVLVYESAGLRDKALEALGGLVKAGSVELVEINPDLADLRKDARYRAIAGGK